MLAQYLDLTDEFINSYNGSLYFVEFETSNYDYAIVQFINFNSDVRLEATIDSGGLQKVTDGNISTSGNYQPVYAINLADNTKVNITPDNGIYRFDVVGRYIKLRNTSGIGTNGKLLVMLAKIS